MTSRKAPRVSARRSPRTIAIVPAAGLGKRLGLRTKKPFVPLKGRPIIARTLEALEKCGAIDEIILASEKRCAARFADLVRRYRFKKVSRIVVGGSTRYQSVKNCIGVIGPECGIVLIHDGARPFIDSRTIEGSIALAREHGACIVAVPETDTVKLIRGDLFIRRTLDRNTIFRAQTPQVFRYEIIRKAFSAKPPRIITDDASLVEAIGKPVKVLVGSRRNIKITTKEDIKLGEALL